LTTKRKAEERRKKEEEEKLYGFVLFSFEGGSGLNCFLCLFLRKTGSDAEERERKKEQKEVSGEISRRKAYVTHRVRNSKSG
jgi:hypothetical protein